MAYANPGSDTCVPVSGTGPVIDDLAKKQALWDMAACDRIDRTAMNAAGTRPAFFFAGREIR